LEVKLLLGCTHEEERIILRFLNDSEYMSAYLVTREDAAPLAAEE
jgi:hypothetical protein